MTEQKNRAEREPGEITRLLLRFQNGEAEAMTILLPIVYDELRKIARQVSSPQNISWQPTALTNELCVILLESEPYNWKNREHFFSTASLKMRHMVVDEVRRRKALKKGGNAPHVVLDNDMVSNATSPHFEDILAVNEALEELDKYYPRAAKVIELAFFLGFSEQEIAVVLNLSTRQVRRDRAFAYAWLGVLLQPTR